MTIELTILNDGGVLIVSDQPYPDDVKRVEYYREQQLFMLVYKQEGLDSDLMHYEIPDEMTAEVEKSPNVIMCSMYKGTNPSAYKVPLIKVGELY